MARAEPDANPPAEAHRPGETTKQDGPSLADPKAWAEASRDAFAQEDDASDCLRRLRHGGFGGLMLLGAGAGAVQAVAPSASLAGRVFLGVLAALVAGFCGALVGELLRGWRHRAARELEAPLEGPLLLACAGGGLGLLLALAMDWRWVVAATAGGMFGGALAGALLADLAVAACVLLTAGRWRRPLSPSARRLLDRRRPGV